MSDHRGASQAERQFFLGGGAEVAAGRAPDLFWPHDAALRSHRGVYWWPRSRGMQWPGLTCATRTMHRCDSEEGRWGSGGILWPLTFLYYAFGIHQCCFCTTDTESDIQVIPDSNWSHAWDITDNIILMISGWNRPSSFQIPDNSWSCQPPLMRLLLIIWKTMPPQTCRAEMMNWFIKKFGCFGLFFKPNIYFSNHSKNIFGIV